MAFDFSFDPEDRLVYVRASASIDLPSSMDAMRLLLGDPRFRKEMKILVDITKVDYAPTELEVLTLLSAPVFRAIVDGHKVAIAAGRPAQYGMLNVLARRTGDGSQIEPFYSVDDARNCLRGS